MNILQALTEPVQNLMNADSLQYALSTQSHEPASPCCTNSAPDDHPRQLQAYQTASIIHTHREKIERTSISHSQARHHQLNQANHPKRNTETTNRETTTIYASHHPPTPPPLNKAKEGGKKEEMQLRDRTAHQPQPSPFPTTPRPQPSRRTSTTSTPPREEGSAQHRPTCKSCGHRCDICDGSKEAEYVAEIRRMGELVGCLRECLRLCEGATERGEETGAGRGERRVKDWAGWDGRYAWDGWGVGDLEVGEERKKSRWCELWEKV
ncbi:hypothetical protein B0O99DRAFT_698038 [Bisporella sp. PMI_857]|nr:hypothetical protein B0O99DRAFT_698038 [Bisporella sp. PMI_857]